MVPNKQSLFIHAFMMSIGLDSVVRDYGRSGKSNNLRHNLDLLILNKNSDLFIQTIFHMAAVFKTKINGNTDTAMNCYCEVNQWTRYIRINIIRCQDIIYIGTFDYTHTYKP